ncbi:staphylokinase [Staphylococcus aureus H19392]|nr:staphylokinase [Staphylococcus aureus H19392]
MLKRSLLFLTVLLLLFSFSSITNEVSASSSFDKGKYIKKAMTRVILNQQARI